MIDMMSRHCQSQCSYTSILLNTVITSKTLVGVVATRSVVCIECLHLYHISTTWMIAPKLQLGIRTTEKSSRKPLIINQCRLLLQSSLSNVFFFVNNPFVVAIFLSKRCVLVSDLFFCLISVMTPSRIVRLIFKLFARGTTWATFSIYSR